MMSWLYARRGVSISRRQSQVLCDEASDAVFTSTNMLNILENITKIMSLWLLLCSGPLTLVFADEPCQVMSSPRNTPIELTVKASTNSVTLWVRGVGSKTQLLQQGSGMVTLRIGPNYCNETEVMFRLAADVDRWIPLCMAVQSKAGDSVNVSCMADIDSIWSTCKLSPYSSSDHCLSMSPCLTSDLPEGFNVYLLTFGGSLTLLLLILIFSLYMCLVHLSNKLVQGDHRVTMSMFEPSRAMCSESESEARYVHSPQPSNGLDSALEKGGNVNETADVYGDADLPVSTLTRRGSAHVSENSLYEANTKPLEYYE